MMERAQSWPVGVDVVVLSGDRHIGVDRFLSTDEEACLVRLAFTNYAYCLRGNHGLWGTRTTLEYFAKAIEMTVDCDDNEVNRSVVDVLSTVHRRLTDAKAQGLVFLETGADGVVRLCKPSSPVGMQEVSHVS